MPSDTCCRSVCCIADDEPLESCRQPFVPDTPGTDEIIAASSGEVDDAEQQAAQLAADELLLPAEHWEVPNVAPLLRGPTYTDDKCKQPAEGSLFTCFAGHVIELDEGAAHIPGASSAMIAGGALMPPSWAKSVLTMYFMNPAPPRSRATRSPNAHALLVHFACADRWSEGTRGGPSARLLREMWCGDAATALSRIKLLAGVRNGPSVLRAALAYMRLDDRRPMLLCRQCETSLHRASILRPFAKGANDRIEHVEVAFDIESMWLGTKVYKNSFSAVGSMECASPETPEPPWSPAQFDLPPVYIYEHPASPCPLPGRISLTFVLEGRSGAELPEEQLGAVTLRGLAPQKTARAPPAAWPASPTDCPGQTFGPFPTAEIDAAIALSVATGSKKARDGEPSESAAIE